MKTFPRVMVFLAILVLGALDISVYWNSRLYSKAMNAEDKRRRIRLLERSNTFCPINELVFYEIGKAYFDLGLEGLSEPRASEQDFRKAARYLERSLMINPASPYAHFYLGQTLIQLSGGRSERQAETYGELRKAIVLGGDDSRISFETGQLFLSRWAKLDASDRDLTLRALKRVLARKDPAQAVMVMNNWQMNVGDSAVMDKILPADPLFYRLFARFLGERSLLLAERQKLLAQAERLDFVSARRLFQRAEAALFRLRLREADDDLQTGLRLLQGIKFYQTLCGQNLISRDEYVDLLKSCWLDVARCAITQGAALAAIEPALREYLALESQPKEISGLEGLLRSRGYLEDKPGEKFDDMKRLAFELLLYYKQTRYREIVDVGRELSRSVALIPQDRKKDYAEVLRLIGDCFQKIDYLYDAGDYYRKALEMDPESFETLLRIRHNYERLNEDKKIRDIDAAIGSLESPAEIVTGPLPLERGAALTRRLAFNRSKVTLEFLFAAAEGKPASPGPLITVNLNGLVVREDFCKEGALTLDVDVDPGQNVLEILPVNGPASLLRLSWRPRPDEKNTPNPRSPN